MLIPHGVEHKPLRRRYLSSSRSVSRSQDLRDACRIDRAPAYIDKRADDRTDHLPTKGRTRDGHIDTRRFIAVNAPRKGLDVESHHFALRRRTRRAYTTKRCEVMLTDKRS